MTDRHVEVVYCDDIRLEMGNKVSYMGIYTADMAVAQIPSAISKLDLAITLMAAAEDPFEHVVVKVFMGETLMFETPELAGYDDDGLPKLKEPPRTDSDGDSSGRMLCLSMHISLAPLLIKEPTKMRVVAETERGELRGRSLKIILAEESSAVGQPAAAAAGSSPPKA